MAENLSAEDKLKIVEEVLVEAFDDEDQDTVYAIVDELRTKFGNESFAMEVTDPDDILELADDDSDEEAIEGDDTADEE